MKVSIRVRRLATSSAADAWYCPDLDAETLLEYASRENLDPDRVAFAAEGGLLVRMPAPETRPAPFPSAARLRELAPSIFVPVDGELFPRLLDDEAAALGRDRGLIFLADGRVLSFDPASPLRLRELLTISVVPARRWSSLPEPPPLASRIDEILVEWPSGGTSADEPPEPGGGPLDQAVEAALDAGDPGDSPEDPGTAPGRGVKGMAGRAIFQAGRGAIRLGQALRWPGLARLGAGWVQSPLGKAPRLAESIFGRQGAALRDLLREFEQGDPERALRRALPLGDTDRGAGLRDVPGSGRLEERDPSYSLGDLLGGDARGPSSIWAAEAEIHARLLREYRLAAERASAAGDYRRAAYIYGRLLRDYRSAALSLQRGGLHRDAGLIYLAKLNDLPSAALAFEAAGDLDRAIKLRIRVGHHEAAGDLLRKIGEEDRAVEQYRKAAEGLSARGDQLAAGNLLLQKARRPDLARESFTQGWASRPARNSSACGLLMAALHIREGDRNGLERLLREADAHFLGAPAAETGAFYNGLLRSIEVEPVESSLRDDLKDRSKLALAASLRARSRSGVVASELLTSLFDDPKLWDPALARDAAFAAGVEGSRFDSPSASMAEPPTPRGELDVGPGLVTATAYARGSGEIYVGLESGEVQVIRPWLNEVRMLADDATPVLAIEPTANGSRVMVLRGEGHQVALTLHERRPDGSQRLLRTRLLDVTGIPWLTPWLETPDDGSPPRLGLWDGRVLQVLEPVSLVTVGRIELNSSSPVAAILLPPDVAGTANPAALVCDGRGWHHRETVGSAAGRTWPMEDDAGSAPLANGRWDFRMTGVEHLEIVWIDPEGALTWFACTLHEDGAPPDIVGAGRCDGPFAVACFRESRLAVVAPDSRVGRVRVPPKWSNLSFYIRANLPEVVACHPCPRTGELIVISRGGRAARIKA